MAKFVVTLTQTLSKVTTYIVEATSEEKAKEMWENGDLYELEPVSSYTEPTTDSEQFEAQRI